VQVFASAKSPVRSSVVCARGDTESPVDVVIGLVVGLSPVHAVRKLPKPIELIPVKIARRDTRRPS